MNSEVIAEPDLNVKRGLIYTLICGLIGLACTLIAGATIHLSDNDFEIQFRDISLNSILNWVYTEWITSRSVKPILGIILYFACTGWATYAPKGEYSPGYTFVKIFLMAIPFYAFLEMVVPNVHSVEHFKFPTIDTALYDFMYVFAPPPVIIAVLLSLIRAGDHSSVS